MLDDIILMILNDMVSHKYGLGKINRIIYDEKSKRIGHIVMFSGGEVVYGKRWEIHCEIEFIHRIIGLSYGIEFNDRFFYVFEE
jgi:hypothetical protein